MKRSVLLFTLVWFCFGLTFNTEAQPRKKGNASAKGKPTAVAGIILGLISAVLPVLLFVPIAWTFNK